MSDGISLCAGCEVFLYAPNYPWVHRHPPWTRAVGLSDIPIAGIHWEIGCLVVDHSPLKSAGRRDGIEDETHVVFTVHLPGSRQCWINEINDWSLDHHRIRDAPVVVGFVLLVALVAVLYNRSRMFRSTPRPRRPCCGAGRPCIWRSRRLLDGPPGLPGTRGLYRLLGTFRRRGGETLTSTQ